ncbi:HEAT repeat domain-containing protein [Streptomyces sp. NPDC053541]|uniref:HEAT repeat domain-containing protein n=1 Tax=Streptomyces sp. NPDC053541 TaxID=3365709 RepID=UPI0037D7EECE
MATFVHLAPAVHAARIRRGGIKAPRAAHRERRGVFLFPVLDSYALTHQWLRELARRPGPRGLVAVHVRLPDGERVTVGRYGEREPEVTTAAGAVRRIRELDDPRGWEVFLPRAVARREVRYVREVRQLHGWRYRPDAHGTAPCVCEACREPGLYGSRRLAERRARPDYGPALPAGTLLARLGRAELRAEIHGDTAALCEVLRWYRLRRRGPLPRVARLTGHPDPEVRQLLAAAVAHWSTPGVDALLRELADDGADAAVRRAVAESIAYRDTPGADALLADLARDPDPRVRDAVVDGLVHRATPEAVALLTLLANDPDARVRETVSLLWDEDEGEDEDVREDEDPEARRD